MSTLWDNIQIKKGTGGHVTEEQKNNLIEHAVSTWERMGLSDDQMAFGIAVMGAESGFNPDAKGLKSKTEYGLGQFIEPTWKEAVNHYNTRPEHKARHEPDIDPDKGRNDVDSQIAVIGAWIPNTWGNALAIPVKKRPKGYGFNEIAYGKWHEGQNKSPEGIGKFLGGPSYSDPDMRDYFTTNLDRARQGLRLRRAGGWVAPYGQP